MRRLHRLAGRVRRRRRRLPRVQAARRGRSPTRPADPAEELKAKLAEARAAGDDREAFEAGETPVDEAPDPDVDARRRAVHEQARAAIDEMQPTEHDRTPKTVVRRLLDGQWPAPVPTDLENALAANPAARERFWALPPEQKDAWVAFVERARFRGARRRRAPSGPPPRRRPRLPSRRAPPPRPSRSRATTGANG